MTLFITKNGKTLWTKKEKVIHTIQKLIGFIEINKTQHTHKNFLKNKFSRRSEGTELSHLVFLHQSIGQVTTPELATNNLEVPHATSSWNWHEISLCGNFMMFPSLRFHMKLILEIPVVPNLPFWQIQRL